MTTLSAIRHEYQEWLTLQVGDSSVNDIHPVCNLMHQKAFVWFISNDDNRLRDGEDLRLEFLYEKYDPSMVHALRLPHVSVLEVLVALSHRLAFFQGGDDCDWAWFLMGNLGLQEFRGKLTPKKREAIDEILDKLIWRQYEPDGQGGFFPLAWPNEDQRKIEIWYQMQNWIGEQHTM